MPNITIKQGDLLDEAVDVIVSTANPHLLMSGGVNGAILMRGGHRVQQELQDHLKTLRRKTVEPGTIVVTGPGPLNCRHIFHAVSINAFYESSLELIAGTIGNVLTTANSMGVTSLAIPALATGYGPLSVGEFAEGLRSALDAYDDPSWLSRLDLRIVIWRSEDVAIAQEIIERSDPLQRTTADNRRDTSMHPPAITNVAEVVLSVRDIPTMRDFYTSVLGFPLLAEACHETGPEPDPDGEPTITFLTIAETDSPLGLHGHPQLLVLIDHQRHVFARARLAGHDVTRSTLNHLAFEIPTDGYEPWQRKLSSLGLEPQTSEFPNMNARALFIKDPEGNTLELICHHATG